MGITKIQEYSRIPPNDIIDKTIDNIKNRGISVIAVGRKEEALKQLKSLIPANASIMNGSSTTLHQIGLMDQLKTGEHQWENLHEHLMKETDYLKQAQMRRNAIVDADYFLGSINAITQDGLLVAVDATGSRVGAYPYAANRLILVAGVQKIVPDLKAAMDRIRNYVFPLENERAKKAYGKGSTFGKWVIIEHEVNPKRITLILVNEALGF